MPSTSSDIQPSPRPGSSALRGGIVCFIIACVIALLPFPTLFLWTVFVFVAFILAIVTMAQGRVRGGIVLLLLCLFVPGPCALVGMAMFTKALSGTSSRSSDYSSSYSQSTSYQSREPSAPRQPTVKPIEPSRRPAEALVAPPVSGTPVIEAELKAEPNKAVLPSSTKSVVTEKPAQHDIALQQTESWPPIDTSAVGQAVVAKVGTSPDVTVIPSLEPRIRLRHSSAGTFTWSNATLDTFLFTKNNIEQFVSLGQVEPVIAAERPSKGKVVGVTSTHEIRWKGTNNLVPKWPDQPLVVITSLAEGTSASVPYPPLPNDILSDNAVVYKIHTVALNAESQIYVLWSVMVNGVAGKKLRWYAAWYDSSAGTQIKQSEIPMESLAGSAQHSVVRDIGPNGLMRTYDNKFGHRVVDPNDLTALPLPKFLDSPRFISAEELRWEKSVRDDNTTIVIASEAGAILRRTSGKLRSVVTIRKQDGAYSEVASAKSTTPSPINDFVWAHPPYLIQPLAGHFLIVDTNSGTILGACEGKEFLQAQVTDSLIRLALSTSSPPEVRIFEILKPKTP